MSFRASLVHIARVSATNLGHEGWKSSMQSWLVFVVTLDRLESSGISINLCDRPFAQAGEQPGSQVQSYSAGPGGWRGFVFPEMGMSFN